MPIFDETILPEQRHNKFSKSNMTFISILRNQMADSYLLNYP